MSSELQKHASAVVKKLKKAYPDAHCALNHSNPFELLVATILSAQCTDERVNIVTADLFRKFRGPADYLGVSQEELAHEIRSITFFNNKARSIQRTATKLIENFGGEVPKTMPDLLTLDGVARKTANVVLGNAYGIASGVVVDTHVLRLSRRMGFTSEKTPEKVELALQEIIPKKDWVMFPHWMITHGRGVCNARKPRCSECVVEDLCPKIEV
jgi:endonuclease III